jgi:hypothetical protein
METPRAHHKLGEAQFFLHWIQREREGNPQWFGYYLSAFLNASYSFAQVLEVEAKRGLKEGAENKKQAKAAFRPWYANWVNTLSTEEHSVWVLMEAQRRDETHLLGAEAVKESRAIPLEPPKNNPAVFYSLMGGGPPAMFADAWMEEKRRLGLPPWVNAWREAQVHHFDIEGERQDVVKTCQRYLALLERLLTDFHNSPLVRSESSGTSSSG